MPKNTQKCPNCNANFYGKGMCSHCGHYIVSTNQNELYSQKEDLVKKYQELSKQLQGFDDLEAKLKSLQIEKNKVLTQINQLEDKIETLKKQLASLQEELKKLNEPSMLMKLKSVIHDKKEKKEKLQEQIYEGNINLELLKNDKASYEQSFINLLNKIEDTEAKISAKQWKKTQLRQLVDEISVGSDETDLIEVEQKLKHMDNKSKKYQEFITIMEDCKYRIDRVIDGYFNLKEKLESMNNENIATLSSSMNKMTNIQTTKKQGKKYVELLTQIYNILESHRNDTFIRSIEDYHLLQKHLSSNIKDINRRFNSTDFDVLSNDVRIIYALSQTIRVWIVALKEKLENQNQAILNEIYELSDKFYTMKKSSIDSYLSGLEEGKI